MDPSSLLMITHVFRPKSVPVSPLPSSIDDDRSIEKTRWVFHSFFHSDTHIICFLSRSKEATQRREEKAEIDNNHRYHGRQQR